MSGDDIRNIANIVGGDKTYSHFAHRIHKEFEMADEDRNTRVFVLYQKNQAGEDVGFAVIGDSEKKMSVWEETFKEEGWVDPGFRMVKPCFELMYMYIRPEERHGGNGSQLFDRVLEFTTNQRVQGIYAYVGDKQPTAINFYQKKGARILKNLSGEGMANAFLEWKL